SSSAFSGVSSLSYNGMYKKLWETLLILERDPFPAVGLLAKQVVDYVRSKMLNGSLSREFNNSRVESAPGTPVNKPFLMSGDSPPTSMEALTPTHGRSKSMQSNV
ncbi:unnamed protein product, partial [Meganyctiphanes norvegica]